MNVLELARQKGIDPKKVASTKGGEYASPCPGCGGDDRFRIWPEEKNGSGSWWCRRCDKGGDGIQFLIEFEGLSFRAACRQLDVVLEGRRRPQFSRLKKESADWQPAPATLPADRWNERAEKFLCWCEEKLLEDNKQLRYLRRRGIKKKTAQRFRLGYNPGKDDKDLWRPRETWGLPVEYRKDGPLRQAQGRRKKNLWLPRGIVIPCLDPKDRILRLRIRRPEGEPKYYVIPGSSMGCMVTATAARAAVVVESELDAILIDQEAGDICNPVALGNSSRKPDEETTGILKKAALVLLALDFDQAGINCMGWWQRVFEKVRDWPVPKGSDPGEAFKEKVNLRKWILAGLPESWNFGPYLMGSSIKKDPIFGQESRPEAAPTETMDVPPAGVRELVVLLKGTPVVIYKNPKRLAIHESNAWAARNWELSQKISRLVYFNPEVFDYIQAHPENSITYKNLIVT
jgi:hypothetical protein